MSGQRGQGQIRADSLRAIRQLVAPPTLTDKDKLRLHRKKLSEDRVSRWPNTITALREQKENAAAERRAAQEVLRKEMDRAEQLKRAEERRAKIEAATDSIYRQTDKMKMLQAANNLSDCLAEREKQIKLRKRIDAAHTRENEYYVRLERKLVAEDETREAAELKKRKDKSMMVARMQQEQLADATERYMEELRAEKREGLEILKQAKEEEERQREARRTALQHAKARRVELQQANIDLEKVRAERAKEEAIEDAKIEAFAKQKLDMKSRQFAREKQLADMKQKRKQDMIDVAVARLAQMNQENDDLLNNQIAEKRAQEDAETARRDARRQRLENVIDNSRQKQLNMRRQRREESERYDREFAKHWKEFNHKLDVEEKQELLAQRRANRKHAEFLLKQADEKNNRGADDVAEEYEAAARLKKMTQDEKDTFMHIAKMSIKEVKRAGKNPYPLVKAVRDSLDEKLLPAC